MEIPESGPEVIGRVIVNETTVIYGDKAKDQGKGGFLGFREQLGGNIRCMVGVYVDTYNRFFQLDSFEIDFFTQEQGGGKVQGGLFRLEKGGKRRIITGSQGKFFKGHPKGKEVIVQGFGGKGEVEGSGQLVFEVVQGFGFYEGRM